MSAPTTLLIAGMAKPYPTATKPSEALAAAAALPTAVALRSRSLRTDCVTRYSDFHALYASPLRRAAESAAILADTIGLRVTSRAHAGLALHNAAVSVWEQQPVAWTRPDAGWRWTLVAHNVLVSGSPLS